MGLYVIAQISLSSNYDYIYLVREKTFEKRSLFSFFFLLFHFWNDVDRNVLQRDHSAEESTECSSDVPESVMSSNKNFTE